MKAVAVVCRCAERFTRGHGGGERDSHSPLPPVLSFCPYVCLPMTLSDL